MNAPANHANSLAGVPVNVIHHLAVSQMIANLSLHAAAPLGIANLGNHVSHTNLATMSAISTRATNMFARKRQKMTLGTVLVAAIPGQIGKTINGKTKNGLRALPATSLIANIEKLFEVKNLAVTSQKRAAKLMLSRPFCIY